MALLLVRAAAARCHNIAVRCACAIVLTALTACGGGSSTDSTAPPTGNEAPAGAIRPGEVPPRLLLGEPRNVDGTSRIALAWASEGAFSGAITAQIWYGINFTPGEIFELQHNGAPAFFDAEDFTGAARFELRYADGFFLLTAQSDNEVGGAGNFGVALTPSGVSNEVPEFLPECTGNDTEPCRYGFINNARWPARAGEQASLLIPRADPAMLTYGVFIKPSPTRDFHETIVGARGQSETFSRGFAITYDFPTASVKVRGCNDAGECVESVERPLQAALLRGVVPIAGSGAAPNAQVALDDAGNRLAFKQTFTNGRSGVRVMQRDENDGRWSFNASIDNPAPGFARTLAFSADGTTLAVEASPCAVATVVCDASTVFVYRIDEFGSQWIERARFDGVRAPRLREDGNLLAGIGVGALRANTVVVFETDGGPWLERPFPALNYTPLDIALSSRGRTLAVVRQGTLADPCGCRAVVVYDRGRDFVWTQGAVLRSNKRLDTVGSPNDDGFGYASGTSRSVALTMDGSMIAVGASLDSSDDSDAVGDSTNHNAPQSGAIYVFRRQPDNTFVKQAFVKPRGAAPLDHFGHNVAISRTGLYLYGGARGLVRHTPGVNRNHAPDQPRPSPTPGAGGTLAGGAAYAFQPSDTGWMHRATMIAPNAPQANFSTFHSLAVNGSGDTVVIGTGVPDASGGTTRRLFIY
jgi:hypothetical protein